MKQARAQSAGLLFFTTLQKIGCASAKKIKQAYFFLPSAFTTLQKIGCASAKKPSKLVLFALTFHYL